MLIFQINGKYFLIMIRVLKVLSLITLCWFLHIKICKKKVYFPSNDFYLAFCLDLRKFLFRKEKSCVAGSLESLSGKIN